MIHLRSYIFVLAVAVASLVCSSAFADEPVSSLFIPHPDGKSKKVEIFIKKPAGAGPWPAVVFVHGHQEKQRTGGQDFCRWGVLDRCARRGYVAVAVSQPGYGNSSGPADFCGPGSQRAVAAVLNALRSTDYIDPSKIAIEGISRGAILAGLAAAQDKSIAAVVLISGVYDLSAYVASYSRAPAFSSRRAIVDAIMDETDGSTESIEKRSVLGQAEKIKVPVLIIYGERDDRSDPHQAEQLARAINSAGGKAQTIGWPQYGHKIPYKVRSAAIEKFLNEVLGSGAEKSPAKH